MRSKPKAPGMRAEGHGRTDAEVTMLYALRDTLRLAAYAAVSERALREIEAFSELLPELKRMLSQVNTDRCPWDDMVFPLAEVIERASWDVDALINGATG